MRVILDTESLKTEMSANAKWACRVGAIVTERREALGLSVRQVAAVIDVPVQTLYRVEKGELIPRDYLRLAIAHVLAVEVVDLFPMPSRQQVAEYMDVAA